MSRTPIIAGNWKMFKTVPEAEGFIAEIKGQAEVAGVETVICAPFTNLPALVAAVQGTTIKIGAQNLHFEDNGAYTGEISGVMLKDLGVEYVIIGHLNAVLISVRRTKSSTKNACGIPSRHYSNCLRRRKA